MPQKSERLTGFLKLSHKKHVGVTLTKHCVLNETYEPIGNSVYGIHFISLPELEKSLFVDEKKAYQKMNSPRFRDQDLFVEKIYEVNI